MFFSSSFLIGYSKLAPKGLLRRLADADFFQQIRKNLKARGGHVPELALVKTVNRLVEGFRRLSPGAATRVFTTRRSSDWRCLVMRPRFSMRSRRRVMSGSWEIMRSPMARQARPSGSAPRRMRRTLYCAAVRPAALTSCSASWLRVSAARRSETKIRFSREMAGREDLELEL